ncbi:sugar lactone lactonase YvrE [Sphingomonas jinjuensis]|uniref:Sugar lactone lactonase YvrE n=2 Tax=Sphingomonas jinjuensis TaxID=535907 RepID=A0A840F9D1_9SPHN|nr:sugar lactone lactonase YvrE [Sphingomonas jinjuensis]
MSDLIVAIGIAAIGDNMMGQESAMTVRQLWDGQALLGEGPVWDAARNCLWFVDIKAPAVHRHDPATGHTDSWAAPAPVGWVLPADNGLLLAGLKTGLHRFDPADGSFTHLSDVESDAPGNRLNDATIGPDGIVWFGSMDDSHEQQSGRVYRWDGERVAATGIDPVCITNGPAVSPDGRILYHVDTVAGIIHAVTIEADGSTGAMRDFATIDPADGNPDGVTCDSQGNVWVGIWGGWCARLYAPDGSILTEVKLPAANVTKVALGGPDLKTAYVTTAHIGLSDEERAGQPAAGNLFAFEVEVPGQRLPTVRMAR